MSETQFIPSWSVSLLLLMLFVALVVWILQSVARDALAAVSYDDGEDCEPYLYPWQGEHDWIIDRTSSGTGRGTEYIDVQQMTCADCGWEIEVTTELRTINESSIEATYQPWKDEDDDGA